MEHNFLWLALTNVGDELVKELTKQLISHDKVATRNLVNSLDFDVIEQAEKLSLVLKADYYLRYVDEGRKKGNPPPTDDIAKWIKVKGISGRSIGSISGKKGKGVSKIKPEQLAFAISRSIGKKGIKATNVINTSINNVLSNLDSLSEAYKQDILRSLSNILLNQ